MMMRGPDGEEEEEEASTQEQQHGGETTIADRFFALERQLADELEEDELHLKSEKVSFVYSPLRYAESVHRQFLRRFLTSKKEILFLGMNPGPWGMMQTGIPFGEVRSVKEFLAITGGDGDGATVRPPPPSRCHPKRPVLGLECARREVSGERLWALIKQVCKSPEVFFEKCFIHNHCPLAYLSASGKNLTPADLPKREREQMVARCDRCLAEVIKLLEVDTVVGIGRYAVLRAERVIADHQIPNVRVVFLNHPSPASAAANRGGGWSGLAEGQLRKSGIWDRIKAS